MFLIDNIIETNNDYKQEVDKIIEKNCQSLTLCEDLKELLVAPNQSITEDFNNA